MRKPWRIGGCRAKNKISRIFSTIVTSVQGYEQDKVDEAEQANDTYQYLDIKGKIHKVNAEIWFKEIIVPIT
jgi:hypothetical protein